MGSLRYLPRNYSHQLGRRTTILEEVVWSYAYGEIMLFSTCFSIGLCIRVNNEMMKMSVLERSSCRCRGSSFVIWIKILE